MGSPVTLVEYGDYERPSCGQAYPIVEAVRAQRGAALVSAVDLVAS